MSTALLPASRDSSLLASACSVGASGAAFSHYGCTAGIDASLILDTGSKRSRRASVRQPFLVHAEHTAEVDVDVHEDEADDDEAFSD